MTTHTTTIIITAKKDSLRKEARTGLPLLTVARTVSRGGQQARLRIQECTMARLAGARSSAHRMQGECQATAYLMAQGRFQSTSWSSRTIAGTDQLLPGRAAVERVLDLAELFLANVRSHRRRPSLLRFFTTTQGSRPTSLSEHLKTDTFTNHIHRWRTTKCCARQPSSIRPDGSTALSYVA